MKRMRALRALAATILLSVFTGAVGICVPPPGLALRDGRPVVAWN